HHRAEHQPPPGPGTEAGRLPGRGERRRRLRDPAPGATGPRRPGGEAPGGALGGPRPVGGGGAAPPGVRPRIVCSTSSEDGRCAGSLARAAPTNACKGGGSAVRSASPLRTLCNTPATVAASKGARPVAANTITVPHANTSVAEVTRPS